MARLHSTFFGPALARAAHRALSFGALVTICSGCSSDGGSNKPDSGTSSGGASGGGSGASSDSGGNATAGASSGGGSSGGARAGGAPNGGGANGGASPGGGNAGASSGGRSSGGAANGGNANGGASSGGADTDGGAGAPADPCKTARFCETFESYATGKPPTPGWNAQMNLGTVSVVDTEHFGGTKSVKFVTQSASGGKTAYIRLDAATVFPVPGNMYFGRMMTRLESAPDQSVHWTFIQSGGLVEGQNYHALYRYGGQQPVKNGTTFVGTQLMANYDTPDSYGGTGPSSDCWNHSNGKVMPVAKWTCVEWQFDGPNDTMRFWLDSAAIDALTVQGKGQGCVHQPMDFEWKAPKFDNVQLGWESYQQDAERTLYIDDVIISTTRIGCPAP
jgi:hypothetical protein